VLDSASAQSGNSSRTTNSSGFTTSSGNSSSNSMSASNTDRNAQTIRAEQQQQMMRRPLLNIQVALMQEVWFHFFSTFFIV